MSVFGRFSVRLQQAIVARLGWTGLREVQELAGLALLDGCNAVILAPTAGGKTEAAMFPALSVWMDAGGEGVGVIYVAPIKALLNNQAERLGVYTEMVGLSRFVWHGDTGASERRRFLKEPADVLMTTPESLEVMLVSPAVNHRRLFGELRMVIIDEIHAVAGTDRGAHLLSVVERLRKVSRCDVQRVGLSATVGNPGEILRWMMGTSGREGRVVDPPKAAGKRAVLGVYRQGLPGLAKDAAKVAKGCKSLFFCQSRSLTEAVAEQMRREGTEVFVHHSAVSKEERALAEEKFHVGEDACIVCTSTLELGIDVGDLDKVLQAEAPDSVSSFLQRMGRTGRRAGQVANTTFFCETSDAVIQAVALVELAREGWVESVAIQGRCWPVVVHQLLAMALAKEGATAAEVWEHVNVLADFKGIRREEYNELVAWMVADESLVKVSGRLVLGPKAEKKFGRKNFMELYAVFSSPQSYTVVTQGGAPVGSLNQEFVDRLVDDVSCFLLGGRAWVVSKIGHEERRVWVESAPRGKQPTWGGYLPQFLGKELCQKMAKVLAGLGDVTWLDKQANDLLATRRAEWQDIEETSQGGIENRGDEIRWWTFAGGKINTTLKAALMEVGEDWKVVPDNFGVVIRGETATELGVRRAIQQLKEPAWWDNDKRWKEIAETLPNYRMSKFQPLMPQWMQQEVVAQALLDVKGTRGWLLEGDRAPDKGRTVLQG